MNFSDSLYVRKVNEEEFDEEGNPVEVESEWVELGKCVILPNSRASHIVSHDGSTYAYTYEVVAPIKTSLYNLIPREGDEVHIVKKDGTIDKIMTVGGFVTYKQRYLKIWL